MPLMWRHCLLPMLVAAVWLMAATATTPAAVNIESDVLHFSYALEQWLSTEVRPCEDFYGYVCGRSQNTTQLQLEQQQQQEQRRFEKFLASDNVDQLMDSELKVKHFHEACRQARSLDALKSSLMYRLSGGWPAADDAAAMIRKRRNMTWLGVLSAFHDVGVEYIFQVRVEIKSNKRVVHVAPDLTTRYTLRKFEQLAGEVMQEYAVEPGRARLVALESMRFERNRRDIVRAEVRDDTELEYSYESFKDSMFGSALREQWDVYFRQILGKSPKPSDTVLVRQMPRLLQYLQLLQNTTMTRLLNWIWIDYLMDKSSRNCQTLVEQYFEPVYEHIVQRATSDKVQMAQMYAALGRTYDQLLPGTPWIDEMSQQNSKQFLGRIMHLTLNGDATLDADYAALTVTTRNFYRNLEKAQRHRADQQRSQASGQRVASSSAELQEASGEYLQIFRGLAALLQEQNLTVPLNYLLVGEHFAEHMIAGGGRTGTPGAWRSMDSEREFVAFKQCLGRQPDAGHAYNANDLLLKLLAQQQTLQALRVWREQQAALAQRLDSLLAAGRLQLSLRRLHFVASLLATCHRQHGGEEQRQLEHAFLRNSPEFTAAFGCRADQALYARSPCKVL